MNTISFEEWVEGVQPETIIFAPQRTPVLSPSEMADQYELVKLLFPWRWPSMG